MASPLGLGFNETSLKRGKANLRYSKIDKKWNKSSNSNYDESLFNEGANITYFPAGNDPSNGYNMEREITSTNATPHGGEMGFRTNVNSIYDVRTQAIIDWMKTQSVSMRLFEKDFAYLRFLGVYPNNRLIVCRKFGTGVDNDLSKVNIKPVSTLLTWRVPGEDFFKISFGEKWTEAEASFTKILNEIGDEFKMGSEGSFDLGTKIGGGLGAIPLPGFTEIFQRQVMFELGLVDEKGRDIIPAGAPNLIKVAKRRETVDPEGAGSGLECKISIPVKIEYEQKFIGGLDPTKAFYDILGNIAHFGTQDGVFYLNGAGDKAIKFKKWMDKLRDRPTDAIIELLQSVINKLKGLVNKIVEALGLGEKPAGSEGGGDGFIDAGSQESSGPSQAQVSSFITGLLEEVAKLVTGIVRKYEVRIKGVVDALTGAPSGPWHVTIGNPKRPLFSSGDMITQDVSVTFGETLAFNDLPSRITVEFTLENARPLGLSEIMSRFMQGQGRTYIAGPSSWSEASTSADFTPNSPQENVPPGATESGSGPVIGGEPTNGSQSDGSENIGSTQSNESFTRGAGQESTSEKEPDPDAVRNVGGVTDAASTTDTTDPLANNTNPNGGPNPLEDPNTDLYTTPGDPYQYKVVDGVWYTKGARKDGTGNIPEWTSLEDNQKATDILNKRHPDAIA